LHPTPATPAARPRSPSESGLSGASSIHNRSVMTRAKQDSLRQRAAAELEQPSTRSFEILLENTCKRLAAAQGRAPEDIDAAAILQAWTDGNSALGQRFAEVVAGEQEHSATLAEIAALERDVIRQVRLDKPGIKDPQIHEEIRKRLVTGDSPEQRALASNNAVAPSLSQRFETLRKKIAPQQPAIEARWEKIEANLPVDTRPEKIPGIKTG
jgi:hypothetical protein